MNRSALLFAVLLLFPGFASADVISLNDGRVLEGSVTPDGDYMVIRHRFGEVRVHKSAVLKIEDTRDAFDQLSKMQAELGTGTADERYRLAAFARENGFEAEAKQAFLSVLRVDLDHPGARVALGYVRHEGRWLTVEDRNRMLGLVEYKGRWVKPEEKAELEKQAKEKAEARKLAKEQAKEKVKADRLARREARREERRERIAAYEAALVRERARRRIAAAYADETPSTYYGLRSRRGYLLPNGQIYPTTGGYYSPYGSYTNTGCRPIRGPKGIAGWTCPSPTYTSPYYGTKIQGSYNGGKWGPELENRVLTRFLLAAVLPLLLLAPAAADEVVLKDGTTLRGEVLGEEAGVLKVAVVRGADRLVLEVPRAQVHLVRRLNNAEERLVTGAEAALLEGNAKGAVELLGKLVVLRPRDARAHRELGFALLLAGRHKDALAPLQEACALDPIDVEAHLQLAQTLAKFRKLDGAITAYRKATRIGPAHVQAWRSLARLLLQRARGADRHEAFDAFRRAAKEDPENESLVLEWAMALIPESPAKARKVLETFIATAPRAALAGRALAQLDAVEGAFVRARKRVEGLLERKDLAPPMRERLEAEAALYGWLHAPAGMASPPGTDAGSVKDVAKAERRLGYLLEVLPDEPRLQLAMARVLLRKQRLPRCRQFLERAALAGPPEVAEDALLLQEVALVLGREGDPPRTFLGEQPSLLRAKRLAHLAPWLEATHRTLGLVLSRQGQFTEAAATFLQGSQRMKDKAAKQRLVAEAREASKLADKKARNAGM